MSMPSDVNPDVSEAVERVGRPPAPEAERWSTEQRGWVVAALVAFVGIAYTGPALGRIFRRPRLEDRIAVRLRDARARARKAGQKAQKRARRLGGGTIRRRG